jgi:hypothetical protein
MLRSYSGSAKEAAMAAQQHNERLVIWIGALLVLAVIALVGFVVYLLLSVITPPVAVAAVLTALAGVLAAIPPIIKSLRGDKR